MKTEPYLESLASEEEDVAPQGPQDPFSLPSEEGEEERGREGEKERKWKHRPLRLQLGWHHPHTPIPAKAQSTKVSAEEAGQSNR